MRRYKEMRDEKGRENFLCVERSESEMEREEEEMEETKRTFKIRRMKGRQTERE